jgi:cellulose synthase/poly-beta-1,6-N-acetylglucosamine synthase-like glycosyltransferase
LHIAEVILIAGFIETVIIFLYALRSYLFTLAAIRARRAIDSPKHGCSWGSTLISVLLPIYNEPNVVDRLLKACTSFNSPPYEVVVIDDSDDGVTSQKLTAWQRCEKVRVIHRDSRSGWKGGALNIGLEHINPDSTHVLIFDADFAPPGDLISRFVARFEDEGVVAVQGYQKHDLNAEENWITKGVRVWHSLYNMVDLNGQSRFGLSSPLTGCVYMIRTDVLRKFRFQEVTTEDIDLTVRLYEGGCKVLFDPTLVASGECPSTLRRLFRQQMRWAEGHTRTFRDHLLKILRCRFLSLGDKVNLLFLGFSFLNSVLVVGLSLALLLTFSFPMYFLPLPIAQASLLLFLVSAPSTVFASLVALTVEGERKDFMKIPYAWILSFVITPFVAYAALKGLLTRKGHFHRTYKTGRISTQRASR